MHGVIKVPIPWYIEHLNSEIIQGAVRSTRAIQFELENQ